MDVFKKHQLRIAKATLKMHCVGALVMGGMNHPQAIAIIKEFTGKTNSRFSDCTCGDYCINK